jgi:cobalamin biosynthesis Mg chelatase CobN
MFQTPHPHGPGLMRSSVVLSVLALLAFACSPALAQAEATVYEVEDTNLPGETKSPPKHKNPDESGKSPKAQASEDSGDGGSGQPAGESSESEDKVSTGNPSTPGGGGGPQGKDGEGAKTAGDTPGGSVQAAVPLETSAATTDDGSSPLVPILIAVAVLAAISVGAVLYRRRRDGDGGISPNAS